MPVTLFLQTHKLDRHRFVIAYIGKIGEDHIEVSAEYLEVTFSARIEQLQTTLLSGPARSSYGAACTAKIVKPLFQAQADATVIVRAVQRACPRPDKTQPGIGIHTPIVVGLSRFNLRIGTPRSRLGETFINLGIIPGDGGAWFLQRLVGYQRAAELTFTGRILEADEALRLGLLLELVEQERLLPRVRELAARIAAKPPHAVRYCKQLLQQARHQPLGDHLEFCATLQGICHQMEDHREAVEAFIERRDPVYRGR